MRVFHTNVIRRRLCNDGCYFSLAVHPVLSLSFHTSPQLIKTTDGEGEEKSMRSRPAPILTGSKQNMAIIQTQIKHETLALDRFVRSHARTSSALLDFFRDLTNARRLRALSIEGQPQSQLINCFQL